MSRYSGCSYGYPYSCAPFIGCGAYGVPPCGIYSAYLPYGVYGVPPCGGYAGVCRPY